MSSEFLSLKAYQYIQAKLLAGVWVAGAMLSEHSVAQELGISRTPVREAFRNLEKEGLLEPVPRYGTRVKALDRRDLIELYELREALEPYAVAQAAGKLQEEDRRRLRVLCDELKMIADELRKKRRDKPDAAMMKRLMSADLGFHQLLIRAAGNRRMMKIVAESRVLARIFSALRQEHTLTVIEETHRYHASILKAVETGDADTARRLMTDHIRASLNEALAHFDQQAKTADQTSNDPLGFPDVLMEDLAQLERRAKAPKTRKKRTS